MNGAERLLLREGTFQRKAAAALNATQSRTYRSITEVRKK
jgi:hypothetical protein